MTHSALDRAAHHAHRYLDQVDARSVAATVTRDDLKARFDIPLRNEGLPADQVIDELARAATRARSPNRARRYRQ